MTVQGCLSSFIKYRSDDDVLRCVTRCVNAQSPKEMGQSNLLEELNLTRKRNTQKFACQVKYSSWLPCHVSALRIMHYKA